MHRDIDDKRWGENMSEKINDNLWFCYFQSEKMNDSKVFGKIIN